MGKHREIASICPAAPPGNLSPGPQRHWTSVESGGMSCWCRRVAGWVAGVAGMIFHSSPVDHSRKFPT